MDNKPSLINLLFETILLFELRMSGKLPTSNSVVFKIYSRHGKT